MENEIIDPAYLHLKKGLEEISKDLILKSEKFSKETKSELESLLEYIELIINHIFFFHKKEELELIKPELLILGGEMISTRDMLLKICDDENVKILKLKADYIIEIIKKIINVINHC